MYESRLSTVVVKIRWNIQLFDETVLKRLEQRKRVGNPIKPKFFGTALCCEPVTSSSTSQRASTAVPERRQASSTSSRTLSSTRQDDVRNVATLGKTKPGESIAFVCLVESSAAHGVD